MTTTEELRKALRAVEPGWVAVDVHEVRERAQRRRRNRRLAAGIGGCAAALAVTLAVPLAGPHLPDGQAPAALPGSAARQPVPRTVAEASQHTELTRRSAALPTVTRPGPKVAVGWHGLRLYLAPPVSVLTPGVPAARASICETGPGYTVPSCENLGALPDGNGWLHLARKGGDGASQAPVLGVLRNPVASVVAATDNDATVPVTVRDLGQGYVLTVAMMPASPGGGSGTPSVKIWAFDDRGRLIARENS